MKTVLLLALITVSEAPIGVFVKLTEGRIPIQTLNFYALMFAAAFLMVTMPVTTGTRLRFPKSNLKDTAIIGLLIALQISVFNFAMTIAPIANVVIFWSIAPFTYGNYFSMPSAGIYRIQVRIHHPRHGQPIEVTFTHEHAKQ